MTALDRILDRYDVRTLEEALARRRKRDRKLLALASRRRALEAELAKLAALMGNGSTGSARKPNARRLNDISLADALEKVLHAKKGPVHYKELTETVVKRGIYRTKSKNLLSTVAVTLKRDGRFKKTQPGLWTLK
jgi:hypothetical protein